MTLSSTHISWLHAFIESARPDCPLFDPLEEVVESIASLSMAGDGRTLGLATKSPDYSATAFRRMLDQLGITLAMHTVRPW